MVSQRLLVDGGGLPVLSRDFFATWLGIWSRATVANVDVVHYLLSELLQLLAINRLCSLLPDSDVRFPHRLLR